MRDKLKFKSGKAEGKALRKFLKKSKLIKIVAVLAAVLLCLLLAVFLFLRLWPAFGGRASKEDERIMLPVRRTTGTGSFTMTGTFRLCGKQTVWKKR